MNGKRLAHGFGSFAILAAVLLLNFSTPTASGFNLFTVPKNKPAKGSSRLYNSGDPTLAYDGSLDGPPTAGANVFHTALGDLQPWWMVDMEQMYAVFAVQVWNRIDLDCAARFSQISFGVSRDSSMWTAYNKDLFDQCYFYSDIPTAATNPININCTAPIVGRYLTVSKNATRFPSGQEYLHFVEIYIYAMSKGSACRMTETKPSFSASSSSLQWSGLRRSQLDCAVECSKMPLCLFALARSDSGGCWLFGSARIPDAFRDGFDNGVASFLVVYG